jgi:hypothetical protein
MFCPVGQVLPDFGGGLFGWPYTENIFSQMLLPQKSFSAKADSMRAIVTSTGLHPAASSVECPT